MITCLITKLILIIILSKPLLWFRHTWQGRRHMTWEQWHVYHSEHNGLFTMYLNLPEREVLACNWSEAGVHSKTSPNRPDFVLAKGCPIQVGAAQ